VYVHVEPNKNKASLLPPIASDATTPSKSSILLRSEYIILSSAFLMNVAQNTKGNQADRQDLVTRILQLLDPIGNMAGTLNQKVSDIDLRVTEDALPSVTAVYVFPLSTMSKSDLENTRDILQLEADRNSVARVANSVGDGKYILSCKELADQGLEVSTTLNKVFCALSDFHLGLHLHNNCAANRRDIRSSRS